MHKNNYNPRTLIGNWNESRSTENFEESNEIAKSYLANPNYNKFIPISKDIGNKKDYERVSLHFEFLKSYNFSIGQAQYFGD